MTLTTGVYTRGQDGFLAPGSPEWSTVITPSKVPAILGISRWESPYRLWHRMKGLVDREPPKEIFDIGHDFEAAAANRWRRRNPGWRLSPGEVQYVQTGLYFPSVATIDRRATRGRAHRVVEFKTARDLSEWGDDFTGECPEDYAAQVMAQMMFTGHTKHSGHLLVLGPFFEEHIYEIEFDVDTAEWIWDGCREFWQSLASDTPPPLDDTVATYECVRALHPDIDGSTVQVSLDLAVDLHDANAESKSAEQRVRGLKTRLLAEMGTAAHAVAGDIKVANRQPHARGGVALALAKKHPRQQLQEQ